MPISDDQRDKWLTFLMANAVDGALTLGLSDELGANVFHINSLIPRALILSITNSVKEQIQIVNPKKPVSDQNFHFQIKFNNNQVGFSANPTVITPNWTIFVASSGGLVTDIYLLSTVDITLDTNSSKDKSISVELHYAGASPITPSDVLQMLVTLGSNVNALTDPVQPVTGTETIPLRTYTDASAPSPLIPTIVEPRTILIGDAKRPLLLRFVNTSPDPVTFVKPLTKGGATPTAIEIRIDIDPAGAWALCKADEADSIVITPPQNWTAGPITKGLKQVAWLFSPNYSNVQGVDGYEVIDFTLTGLKTTLPPGFANVYVTLREFPLYGTQTIIAQIEKSPLIYSSGLDSGLLSQSTTGTTPGFDLVGDTKAAVLRVEQDGAGRSAHFVGGVGIVVDTDARLNDGALWLRKDGDQNHGVAVYGGNLNTNRPTFAQKDINGPVVFGFEGGALGTTDPGQQIELSWRKTGQVGIATNDPKSVLSVKGGLAVGSTYAETKTAAPNNLLVEGNIGVGTDQPKSPISVNGGMAVGAIYADSHAAPANGLLVEGKVGIATNNPIGPLAIGDASQPGADGYIVLGKRSDKGTRQYRMGFDEAFNFTIGDYGDNNQPGDWTSPFSMMWNAPSHSLHIDGGGNVGIGTANPLGPLSVGDSSVDKSDGFIVVGKKSGQATRQFRLGFDANFNFVIGDYGFNNKPANWTPAFAIAWEAPSNSFVMNANGYVGLGASPTKAALEVDQSLFPQSITTDFGLVDEDGCYYHAQNLPDQRSISIYCKEVFWCNSWVIASSDARIKRVQGVSDGAADLSTLLAIEVTDFTYIDALANGNKNHKKVIAQQVQEVFPQAVTQTTNEVPDIYQRATIKDGWVQLATDLKKGDRVRLVGAKSEGVKEVLEVADGKFRTDFVADSDQVFVYGREVKDFLNVDYDAIAMLNVSATQQIKKEKDAEVRELREENAALRSRLEKLEKLMERFVMAEAL